MRDTTQDIERALEILRSGDHGDDPATIWNAFGADHRPALFRLLGLAADLPRLAGQRALEDWPGALWPEFDRVTGDLARLQRLVDEPVIPSWASLAESRDVRRAEGLAAAAEELAARHGVTVDGLLDPAARDALDREIEALHAAKLGTWGALERAEAPAVHAIWDTALGGETFRLLTGFDPSQGDEYSLTLSLQDLDARGIGWHRDLYWPVEWVGEDVFAVLYGLGDDTPELGGAFVYHVPWENAVLATYRKRHQATILWNSADSGGRLLHAVSGYHTARTTRHLLILQCLRRQR